MPPPNRAIRGVTDLRTHSGTPDQVIVPYKAYMAITALEMEKFRRETECHNLTTRLNSVSAHLRRHSATLEYLLIAGLARNVPLCGIPYSPSRLGRDETSMKSGGTLSFGREAPG